MFDFAPLSASHFIFLLLSFVVSYSAISLWRAHYAGIIVAIVATSAAVAAIPHESLRLGLIAAVILTVAIGRADEGSPLTAGAQLFWQLCIAGLLVAFGWNIPYVSHPFGEGVLSLGVFMIPLTVAWIVLMMNAINWLDGLDGLASSVAVVAFLALAAVSLLPATQDSTTLSLALIGAGSVLAFFLRNAPPAKIYLGTTGSWFIGIFLALTAMIGGGKVATATLVLALPLLDAAFVIAARLLARQRPWIGDRKHLHYRLAALGWSPRQIVFAAALFSALLGVIAVTTQTQQKIWALGIVALFLLVTILTLSYATYLREKIAHR